jgi:hypothetical protein
MVKCEVCGDEVETTAEPFSVICDETNNPPEVVEDGRVIVDLMIRLPGSRVLCGGGACRKSARTIPRGEYRHYKGGRYYVLAVAEHHETRAPMVLYFSFDHGTFNIRPLYGSAGDPDGWLDPGPGGVERFTFVVRG